MGGELMSTIEAILVLALGAAFYWGYLRFKAEKAMKAEQTIEEVIEEIDKAEVTE